MSRRLMRADAVADYIGQSVAWARTAMADGTIPGAFKARSRWMVAQADVDAWIDAGRPNRPEQTGEPYRPFPRSLSRTADA